MEADMTGISGKGDRLSELVGASEEPVVSTSVSGVNDEYRQLKETWRERLEQLQASLDQTNKFQAELVNILNWLQGLLLSCVCVSGSMRCGVCSRNLETLNNAWSI